MKTRKKSIPLIFLFSMLCTTFPAIFILGYLCISAEHRRFNEESVVIKSEYIESQKTLIKNEVNRVIGYINYKRSLKETRLKQAIKNRVYEAYAIAEHIYNENKSHMSTAEIKQMIIHALKPMRYNNGRGYYFALHLDGTGQISNDAAYEGANIIDMQDADDKYLFRDMIELVQTKGEGFYEYKWRKPGFENRDQSKISFVKYFEPLEWLIGSGEYLDDVRKDIQKEIFGYVDKIRFGTTNQNYVFICKLLNIQGGDQFGIMLINPNRPDLIGEYLSDNVTDAEGKYFVKELLEGIRRKGEAFVSYGYKKMDSEEPKPKISFFKLYKEWDFIVAAGAYVDDIEGYISQQHAALEHRVKNNVIKIILILLILIVCITSLVHYIARKINSNLHLLNSFFEKAATDSKPIDTGHFYTTEFETLANSTNQMLEKRRQAEMALSRAHNELELKIEQRTSELVLANHQLELEIEERRQTEEMLRLERDNLSNILNSMKDGVCIINQNFEIRYANPNLLKAFGPIEGKTCYEYFWGLRKMCKKCRSMEVLAGKTLDCEWTSPRNKKTYKIVDTPFKNLDGTVSRLVMFHDITQTKMLQNQLLCSERLAATGQLAASIAHEINSPLQGITALLNFMQKAAAKDKELSENMGLLKGAFASIRDTVKKLMDLNRPVQEKIQPFEANSVIKDTVSLTRTYLKKNGIKVKLNLYSESAWIKGSRQLIGQVIMNLINNAVEAINDASQSGKDSQNIQKASNAISIDTSVKNGMVLIKVSDTGPGIPDKALPHIFDPFYTTKKTKGMGVGLSICHGIITDHQGTIMASNTSDGGAVFTISLPLMKQCDACAT